MPLQSWWAWQSCTVSVVSSVCCWYIELCSHCVISITPFTESEQIQAIIYEDTPKTEVVPDIAAPSNSRNWLQPKSVRINEITAVSLLILSERRQKRMQSANGSITKGYSIPKTTPAIVNLDSMSMHSIGRGTGQTSASGQAEVVNIMHWTGIQVIEGMITIQIILSTIRALPLIMMFQISGIHKKDTRTSSSL